MKMYNFNQFKVLEWEENKDLPRANWIEYMDGLYTQIKKIIIPNIPSNFKVDYDRGKKITIHTNSKKDLVISIALSEDKIWYSVKPVKGVEFEFNFSFSNKTDEIIKNIKDEFEKDPNKGLSEDNKPKVIQKDEDEFELSEPTITKATRHKRSIDIKIIKTVLEDAFIIDDIDLKNTTIEELLRRMLIESRK